MVRSGWRAAPGPRWATWVAVAFMACAWLAVARPAGAADPPAGLPAPTRGGAPVAAGPASEPGGESKAEPNAEPNAEPLGAPAGDPVLATRVPEDPASPEPPYVRTHGDRFEVVSDGVAVPITFRGVNLGAGVPGHFPGEFAFTRDDYTRYLRLARDLHANAVRVYTLHPPAFYQALREVNAEDPDRPLWLFQGVWTELPESDDFWDSAFTADFHRELGVAVDAIHGNTEVAPRPGHASGRYDADVSPWLAGWLVGREWEPFAVRETERRHPASTWYHGASFTVDQGTAMETWLARACDQVAERERSRYGVAHAVSFVNWPTLDVMIHPTESEAGGVQAQHDEDSYVVDATRLRATREVGRESGFLGYFASEHVYPYYPDFLNLDPDYSAFRDRHGVCNYAGYLADLKAHTPGLPLLIAEYGIPSSRGLSHVQRQGLDHGGASDARQGAQLKRLLEDIEDQGCAGSLLFALFDEWFKTNWLLVSSEQPRDRDPLWHNLLDPEEGYGLLSFDPPPAIAIDGDVRDWKGIAPYAHSTGAVPKAGRMVRALYVTSDQSRLYLRLDLDPEALHGRARAFGVALDVLDPRRGDTRLPAPLDATWSRGAEFVLMVDPGRTGRDTPRAELFADRRMAWSEYARVRQGDSLVALEAPMRPAANHDGRYAPLIVNVNRARVGRDGRIYPGRDLDTGRLARGREVRAANADTVRSFEPGSEWWLDRARGVLEIALPWGLLNVGDPSSLAVLDDTTGTPGIERSTTTGIGLLAFATRADGFRADSLGPTREGARMARSWETQFLGPPGTTQTIAGQSIAMTSPDSISYLWNGWQRPITLERIKRSAEIVRQAFEERASRDARTDRELNAFTPAGNARRRPRAPGRGARPVRVRAGHSGPRPAGLAAGDRPR
jgi:hypothetical protein